MLGRLKFELDELSNEMLDQLPKEIFESKTITFLDPCMGGGQFVVSIERRLRQHGHSDANIAKRVYGVESSELRHNYAINKHALVGQYFVCENYLEYDEKMKFDVVIGNPPYGLSADQGKKRDSAANLWPLFVIKSFSLLHQNGYLAMITPNGWMTPSADVGKGTSGIKIYNLMREQNTLTININECGKHFDVGSSFTYYVIQNAPYSGNTNVVTENGSFDLNLSEVNHCPSNFEKNSLSLNRKILAGEPIGFTNNNTTMGLNAGRDFSESPSKKYNQKCYHSSANKGTYVFSSYQHKLFNQKKVMVCSSGYYLPVYDNGKLGYTHKIYVYHLQKGETLAALKSYLNSKLVRKVLENNKTSGWVSYALRLLPKIDLSRTWTDEELYKYFKLTKKEIEYIENAVK